MVGDTIEGTLAGGHRSRRGYAARLATLAAASTLVAGTVTGCTTSAGGVGATPTATGGTATTTATISPTVTPTASASTAPTAAYPADVPAEARANTPAGAIAFARYFFGLVNRAYTTPQAGLLAPLSTTNCKTCAAFESTAADFVAKSQRYDRAAVTILEVAIDSDPPPAGMTLVDVVVDQLPAKVIDSKGATATTITGRRGVFVAQLRFTSAGWTVDTIQVMG